MHAANTFGRGRLGGSRRGGLEVNECMVNQKCAFSSKWLRFMGTAGPKHALVLIICNAFMHDEKDTSA